MSFRRVSRSVGDWRRLKVISFTATARLRLPVTPPSNSWQIAVQATTPTVTTSRRSPGFDLHKKLSNIEGTTAHLSRIKGIIQPNYVMETLTLAVEKLETILVVEDVEEVLQLCVFILESANFVVLKATGGDNAIKVAANHDGNIDLLLSDVN